MNNLREYDANYNEQTDLHIIINDFNNTLLSLAHNIASVCPNSIIGSNIKDIDKAIKKRDNFTKFIDLFCIKVLQYKKKIDDEEEDFFMDKDYQSDLQGCDESYLGNVISVKSIWKDLTQENKQIVIKFFQILCELSQEYFNTFQG